MKKYAIYLPQFHEIEQNNRWWGKGYTEWTCVRKAEPLYKNHKQPKLPENENYYNLLDKKSLEWQARIAKENGIDGFVIYHYWFKGQLIMEKPVELLLDNEDIDIEYYLCWANHTWYKGAGKDRTVLINQEYGDTSDWLDHYKYLSRFFHDSRYKKIDNKPVLMLYNSAFKEKNEMLDYIDRLAKEDGFDGLYVIEVYKENLSYKRIRRFKNGLWSKTNAIFIREPSVSIAEYYKKHFFIRVWIRLIKPIMESKGIVIKKVHKISGNKLYDSLVKYNEKGFGDIRIIRGLCFEWDNTPRHKYRGYIVTPPDKEKFDIYMNSIIDKDELIINAWNEWAEGMMLEPTQSDGSKYLNWIKEWKGQ
ncbi:Glycosyltransferase WbsX [Pseudobutyrivibrio ruminis]|uniref:Glycosyltransferase WbsX n=1 Tax=Pseudobutyrivibrio ruminis TaxID=46206 RepID=A0A1H7H6N2_9FIRM|nr:glycoside hydrolase family 99-like domain-containing protein [Pseudobutyrivibrio ruminis]SEK45417.1 Glycosyltransferase WbsX [Pseudobutyrivibrio ruminis]